MEKGSGNKPARKPLHTLAGLAEALDETFHGNSLFQGPPHSRKRYIHAIDLIRKYLQANGVHPHVYLEFQEFGDALRELDYGIVRHFLEPRTVESRPVDPADIWLARAFLAVAADLTLANGAKSKAAAAREIAALTAPLAEVLSKPGGNYAGAIAKWCRDFTKGEVKSRSALEFFNLRQATAEGWRRRMRDQCVPEEKIEQCVIDEFLGAAARASARAANPEQWKTVRTALQKQGG